MSSASASPPLSSFALPFIEAVPADDAFARAVDAELLAKTKPPGSLGALELLAARIARIQRRQMPTLEHAQSIVFAGDHGITAEGVSAYPSAVTAQMVANFLAGGAAICVLAREFQASQMVVDAGVAPALPANPLLIDRKIALGIENFAHAPAMHRDQCVSALQAGVEIGRGLAPYGVLMPGEMGIGNTTSAAALMHAFTGLPVEDCIGRGTGVNDEGLARKRKALIVLEVHRDAELGIIEVGEAAISAVALLHQVDAALVGRVVVCKRVVLREVPTGLGWERVRPAGLQVELPTGGEQGVAQLLRGDLTPRHQGVFAARLLVGGATHDEAVHRFDAPASIHELPGEVVE